MLGARVKRTYGSTEAPTITTSRPDDPVERGWETDGRPVGEVEVRLGPSNELWCAAPSCSRATPTPRRPRRS